MSRLSIFVPLTKIDVEKRLVYGVATAEQKDRSGEVMDYLTTKPHYEKWSNDLHAASGGLSKGNLRAMHGKTAAGKLTDITFNDVQKQVEVCAKVVDENEWNKVVEGVYTGFSHGGSYAKRWTENGVTKYTAVPTEISLVDLPCLASATFEMVKGEGLVEQRHFAEAVTIKPPSNADVAAKAADLAKAAGKTEFEPFLGQARDDLMKAVLPAPEPLVDAPAEGTPEPKPGDAEPVAKAAPVDEYEQVWKSKRDGETFLTKADLQRHHQKLDADAAIAGVTGPAAAALEKLDEVLGGEKKPGRPRLVKFTGPDALEKSMAHVARLANTVADLSSLHDSIKSEATREGDGSPVPDGVKASLKSLGDNLKSMCGEEVDELMARKDGANPAPQGYYDSMAMAAGKVPEDHLGALVKFAAETPTLSAAARDTLEKLGARNSKTDSAKIQAMHDHACDLGATCGGSASKAEPTGDLSKAADDLAKMTTDRDRVVIERDSLSKSVVAMTESLERVSKTLAALPVPLHLQGRAIDKAQDSAGNDNKSMSDDDLSKALAAMSPEDRALVLTKAAQSIPLKIGA